MALDPVMALTYAGLSNGTTVGRHSDSEIASFDQINSLFENVFISSDGLPHLLQFIWAGLGGSVVCAVRLETRRSRVQPPPRSATFFRGD